MRKLSALLAFIVLLVIVVVPTFAQERPTLSELLTDDAAARFTTLISLIEAAGLEGAFSNEGPYTVLAPTNDAFTAALEDLGMSADDLMADTATLNDILLYHVIPGQYFFRNLTSGPTLDTALEGESVTFDLTDGVFTANGVNILDTDNLASNGIVHVLEDGILLPSAVQEATAANRAHFRVAHFSPDAGPRDIYINGDLTELTAMEFGTVSDWMDIAAGTVSISFAPAGETTSVGTGTELEAGSWVTIAAIGSVDAQRMEVQFLIEDFSPVRDGVARLSFFHAVEGGPVVDILANGDLLVSTLGYPGTLGDNDGFDIREVGAATYTIQAVPNGATEPVLVELADEPFTSGVNYFVAFIGTATSPQAVVVPTDVAAVTEPAE